jgi:hypothetical protein
MALLQALKEVAFIFCPIFPFLMAIPVLLAFHPLPCIRSSIFSKENAFPLYLAINPLSLVHFPVCTDSSSIPMRYIVLPVSFIDGAIALNLPASPIAFIIIPLTVIDHSLLHENWIPLLEGICFGELIRSKSTKELLYSIRALFWELLILTDLFLSLFIDIQQVNIRFFVQTFTSLAISHF